LIARYREVLGRLWLLNTGEAPSSARHHRADLETARELLAEQARLCDELGAKLAAAIGLQAALGWVSRTGWCSWCGLRGVFHDPETESGDPGGNDTHR
jgi:hypothetical protein